MIPGDGDIVEGIATVDESAITGESAPVIRESGGDRSAVTGGTRVLSDEIVVQITAKPGETFLDRMIALVEGADRQKTPNEIALTILLAGLTIIFLLAVVTLQPFAIYSGAEQSVVVLVALLVCLIPTTIGGLLSSIGIAGMDRLVQRNVLAMSGRAVEAAGDVTTLLLDKTGTITYGSRQAAEFIPVHDVDEREARRRRDDVVARRRDTRGPLDRRARGRACSTSHRSTIRRRRSCRSPPRPACRAWTSRAAGSCARAPPTRSAASSRPKGELVPLELLPIVEQVSRDGATPLVVIDKAGAADPWRVLGVIRLKDTVKPGMRERFDQLRSMGIRTIMITGDNPLTAAAIADEAGVDGFLAEATPEDKMALIKREQAGGNLVAMTGDGTNDAPALAQADVGVAMNTGTQAAKEAGNMVDLDSNPTKLIEIVEVGKQLLMTRGSLTTFSIANDVAKYFAIIPAMFSGRAAGARRPQPDAPVEPAVGDPLGGHLQRPDHRRPRAARPARRQVPRRSRGPGAAPQPADLRPRRPRRPVRRHQAHRHRRHRAGSQLTCNPSSANSARPSWPSSCSPSSSASPTRWSVTAVGQVAFHDKANGSLIEVDGVVVGSELLGQNFVAPEYFHPRPSAAGAGYDASASSGSNYGPANPDFLAAVDERVAAYRDGERPRPTTRWCRSTPSPLRRPGSTRPSRSPTPASRRRASPPSEASSSAEVLSLIDDHTDGPRPRRPRRTGRQRAPAQPGARCAVTDRM